VGSSTTDELQAVTVAPCLTHRLWQWGLLRLRNCRLWQWRLVRLTGCDSGVFSDWGTAGCDSGALSDSQAVTVAPCPTHRLWQWGLLRLRNCRLWQWRLVWLRNYKPCHTRRRLHSDVLKVTQRTTAVSRRNTTALQTATER